jgi:hypothetical protein
MEDIVKKNTGIFLLLFILGFLGGTFIPMIAHNLTGLVTLGYCPDINGDGVVNVGDQLLVGGYINQTNCPTYDCDLDNDGIVTQADANLVASNADKYGYDITDCAGAFHYGALRIHTNPADILVQVYVDDVLRSTTTPVTLNNINAGTHSVKIVRSGYTDWIVSTDVQEGLLADVSFDLTTQVACSADSNCPGGAGGASSPFCLNGDLYSYYGSTKCINPGTASSYCGQVNETRLVQDCAYGCSNNVCNSAPANLSCHTLGTTMYYSSANAYYIGCDIKIDTGKTDFDLSKSYCSASVTGKSAYLKPDAYGRADQYYATLTGLVANDVVSVYAWSTSQNKGVECLPKLNQQTAQPSCTDSDVSLSNWYDQLKVKGTCTDYSGTKTDVATSSDFVTEYYCTGTTCGSTGYSCSYFVGQDYIAQDGACRLKTNVTATCIDSDYGINNLTAGYVYGIRSDGTSYTSYDSCSGSSLSEQYCCGTSNCVAAITCANGCNTTTNNKCNPSPVINPTCTDSDGGKNYYVYGRTNDSTGNINTDACSSSTQLREAYCANSLSQYEWINCQYGCSNGVCNQAPQNQTNQTNTTIPCVDPDNGKNYLVAAQCTDYTLNQYMTDACSGSMLREAYCSNNACKYDWVTCTYGCSNNACTNGPCTDSDAYISDYIERLKVKGTCTDYSGTKTDNATSSNFVTEYYCTGTTCGSTGYSCSYFAGQDYVAEDGACRLKTNGTSSTIPNSCTDPDGGYNIYVYSQPYGYLNGASYKYYDYCVSPNMLREFYCSGTNLASYNVACSYGCSNGVCNQASQNQTTQTNTTPTCSDSDNGIINITAGYVYGTNSLGVSYRYDDTCSGSSLSEMYCISNKPAVAAMTCANGCNTTTNNKCNKPVMSQYSCIDTDNPTKHYYLKGTVKGTGPSGAYTLTDYCPTGEKLTEYYCSQNLYSSENYACPWGCGNGACLYQSQSNLTTPTTFNCTDTDNGINIYLRGTCNAPSYDNISDQCVGEVQILEIGCTASQNCLGDVMKCDQGMACHNGACGNLCSDEDKDGYYSVMKLTTDNRINPGDWFRLKTECSTRFMKFYRFGGDSIIIFNNKYMGNYPMMWTKDTSSMDAADMYETWTFTPAGSGTITYDGCTVPFTVTKTTASWYFTSPNIVKTDRSTYCPLGNDCEGTNANINPGKTEICGNGVDDNCNKQVDENCDGNLTLMRLATLQGDSCTDSDFGNVTGLKGSVYGYLNNLSYEKTDSCLNTQILTENYCAGPRALSYQTTCSFGCSEGACKAAVQSDSCTDTDGNPTGYVYSYNINVKGTASGYKIGVPYANTDYCIEGGNTLMEFYCSGINTYSHETECMYGCVDGACLATNPGGCTETDNGNDIYKKGTSTALIKGATYSYDDNCTSSTLLREYYCQNGIAYTWPQMCTYGCSNGACMKSVPGYECNDTDTGYDLYAKGTVSVLVNWRPYKATDVCISPTQVTENYCSLGKPYAWNATCWYGCYDGACSQTLRDPSQITCTDSDSGINYNFKGSVTYKWFNTYSNYTDYCYNNNAALAEYYCSPDNYARISTKACACSDGKCV